MINSLIPSLFKLRMIAQASTTQFTQALSDRDASSQSAVLNQAAHTTASSPLNLIQQKIKPITHLISSPH